MSAPLIKDSGAYVVAATAANGLAFIIPNTSPFVVGALVDRFPLTDEKAGLLLTFELLAMGIASMAVAPYMGVLSQKRCAAIAVLIMTLANAAVCFSLVSHFDTLIATRVIAGIATGIVLSVANAAIAGSALPSRLYGLALMVAWFIAAGLGPVMAWAVERGGFKGAYGVWMVLSALTLALLGGLENRQVEHHAEEPAAPKAGSLGVVHLGAIVLVSISMMAYFAFLERLARSVGFSLSQVGILFAGVSIAGALGAALAGMLGNRYGLVRPLLGSTVLHAAAIILAVTSHFKWLFVAGAMGEGFTFMYLLAYQLATAATLDRRGRWAAAAAGAMIGSTGLGPYAGGALIAVYGFAALGWLSAVANAFAVAGFAWVATRLPPAPR
jgi:MFS family permease